MILNHLLFLHGLIAQDFDKVEFEFMNNGYFVYEIVCYRFKYRRRININFLIEGSEKIEKDYKELIKELGKFTAK